MIRLGSILGLPVIGGGRMLGKVEQTVLTEDGRRLRGLIIRRGMGGARYLAMDAVQALGRVAVIAQGKPGKVPRNADFALGCVRDTAGLELGRVTDVYLADEGDRVTALEITLGPLEELRCGRMLAREFAVCAGPGELGQVLIPTGCTLEKCPSIINKEG